MSKFSSPPSFDMPLLVTYSRKLRKQTIDVIVRAIYINRVEGTYQVTETVPPPTEAEHQQARYDQLK